MPAILYWKQQPKKERFMNIDSGRMRANSSSKENGFTIVELLIVIVVIAILATITVVAFNGIMDRAKATSLQADLNNASKKLKLYQADYGYYPTSLDATTYCPTPTDTNYCLSVSPGNTLTSYSVNNSANPQTFSIDASNANGTRYFVSESSSATSSTATFTAGSITGTVRTGSTVTAGAVTPSTATYTRQWQRSTAAAGTYADIAGATGNTYTIPAGDMGYYLRVLTTGTGAYSSSLTSAATARVTTLVTAIAPITGSPVVGQTLTAGARTPAAATVSYQWRANGVAISGATAATFVVTAAQLGATITVSVTGTTNYSGTVTSAATAAVT